MGPSRAATLAFASQRRTRPATRRRTHRRRSGERDPQLLPPPPPPPPRQSRQYDAPPPTASCLSFAAAAVEIAPPWHRDAQSSATADAAVATAATLATPTDSRYAAFSMQIPPRLPPCSEHHPADVARRDLSPAPPPLPPPPPPPPPGFAARAVAGEVSSSPPPSSPPGLPAVFRWSLLHDACRSRSRCRSTPSRADGKTPPSGRTLRSLAPVAMNGSPLWLPLRSCQHIEALGPP
jgi:hypothetical protein